VHVVGHHDHDHERADERDDARRRAHQHSHGPSLARAGERHAGRLTVALVLIATFFVVEVVAGFWTNSLALLSDAGHMLTDVIGLGMALAAIRLASRFARTERTSREPTVHTFGLYRLEILAAFVNALALFAVAIWVLVEAVRRLGDEPEVLGAPMLVVAVAGLAVNLVALALLHEGAAESMNVQGASLEVLADAISSVGVIVAALGLQLFGWTWIDPVVGALVGVWILPRTLRLGRSAAHVLMQSAPPHVDLGGLRDALAALPGVTDVHDLHVWTLTSEMDAASAHLVVREGADQHAVLDQARVALAERYGIDHGTFQIEPESHSGCSDVHW
jgi:cobalt-zinc-cadmium efflux system protein